MRRNGKACLLALALVSLSDDDARGGSVHLRYTKAEVEAARIRLYEHEMNLRAHDPSGFDHKHPVLGKLLASEQGYDEFLKERTFHHGLLCVHTPFLWRVVEGDILYHKINPWVTLPLVPDGRPGLLVVDPQGGGGSGNHDPGGSGGGPHPNSVPEPSSWVLMASGLVLALLAFARRRIHRFAAGHKRKSATV